MNSFIVMGTEKSREMAAFEQQKQVIRTKSFDLTGTYGDGYLTAESVEVN